MRSACSYVHNLRSHCKQRLPLRLVFYYRYLSVPAWPDILSKKIHQSGALQKTDYFSKVVNILANFVKMYFRKKLPNEWAIFSKIQQRKNNAQMARFRTIWCLSYQKVQIFGYIYLYIYVTCSFYIFVNFCQHSMVGHIFYTHFVPIYWIILVK
jgi:hypothetical protein